MLIKRRHPLMGPHMPDSSLKPQLAATQPVSWTHEPFILLLQSSSRRQREPEEEAHRASVALFKVSTE